MGELSTDRPEPLYTGLDRSALTWAPGACEWTASFRTIWATERKLPVSAGERFDLVISTFLHYHSNEAAGTVVVLLFEVPLFEATIFGCRASCSSISYHIIQVTL